MKDILKHLDKNHGDAPEDNSGAIIPLGVFLIVLFLGTSCFWIAVGVILYLFQIITIK